MNPDNARRSAPRPAPGDGWRAIRTTAVGASLVLLGAVGLAQSAPSQHLRVGTADLVRCTPAGAWCGNLDRPLDPDGEIDGRLPIGFEFYRHGRAGPANGTIVATEGGPGFPARASREAYLALFRPLLADHDLLLMDNRGTGTSAAVDCPSLQRPDTAFTVEAVAECGALLGTAAWLYSTAYAADDLAALLDALGIARIDLYGDSYGTYTAQTFAIRHPDRLRTLVLDGAYPLIGPEPGWYPTYAPAMRDKFNAVCARAPACAERPGDGIDHVRAALRELREHPRDAEALDADGNPVRLRADAAALATAMFGAAPAYATVRELDAAARAFVSGDRTPLQRLLAEAHSAVESRYPDNDPRDFSSGAAAAVMCGDTPQIFDMSLPPESRIRARDRAIAEREAREPDAYAPFTFAEYRAIPLDYAFIDECVLWPAVSAQRAAAIRTPPAPRYPDIPVLVLSGELDNITTVADGQAAARDFPRARQVILSNSFHVNALEHARSACGASLVRHFVATGRFGDDSCARDIAPVRLVAGFAERMSDVPSPIIARDRALGEDRARLVVSTAATVADVIVRAMSNSSGHGAGLRGGDFTAVPRPDTTLIRLNAVRWASDLAVSGTIRVSDRYRRVAAQLSVKAPAQRGHLALTWWDRAPDALATVRGRVGGKPVHGQLAIP